MTIHYPDPYTPLLESPRYRGACQSEASCIARRFPAWDNLNARLPGKVAVTDIDGMVELSGQFLFLESKTGREFPDGQRRALLALSESPNVTVLVTRPATRAGLTENLWFVGGHGSGWRDWTSADYWRFINRWIERAIA